MPARLRAASNDARPAVEVHRLRKTYPGGVEAVRSIDFQVAPGEVFGLLGPNGAGKSTTIGMLTTTIKPTSGSARLAGFDVVRNPIAARAISSVVFQESVLDKALTGRRNLDLHARLWGISPQRIETRTIDMHIARLRTKLRDPSGKQTPEAILTVRAQGYMASPDLLPAAEAQAGGSAS